MLWSIYVRKLNYGMAPSLYFSKMMVKYFNNVASMEQNLLKILLLLHSLNLVSSKVSSDLTSLFLAIFSLIPAVWSANNYMSDVFHWPCTFNGVTQNDIFSMHGLMSVLMQILIFLNIHLPHLFGVENTQV